LVRARTKDADAIQEGKSPVSCLGGSHQHYLSGTGDRIGDRTHYAYRVCADRSGEPDDSGDEGQAAAGAQADHEGS
jgi:hypothetical protein